MAWLHKLLKLSQPLLVVDVLPLLVVGVLGARMWYSNETLLLSTLAFAAVLAIMFNCFLRSFLQGIEEDLVSQSACALRASCRDYAATRLHCPCATLTGLGRVALLVLPFFADPSDLFLTVLAVDLILFLMAIAPALALGAQSLWSAGVAFAVLPT